MIEKEIRLLLSVSDTSWTLFLDRDGVINVNREKSYVTNLDEFVFIEGAIEAITALSQRFGRIIVVTNQRGVGNRLMTLQDLNDIHERMREQIQNAGGRLDAIYYCTSPMDDHPDRKPNPGMAEKAQVEFPEIDFTKSIVVGDKASDMKFGRNIGAFTIWISSETYQSTMISADIDYVCGSLFEFANLFSSEGGQ